MRTAVFILALPLLASLIASAVLYPRATRPLVGPGDAALVERARLDAAAVFRISPAEAAEAAFPIVTRLPGRTCVELRSTRRGRAGNYFACYDGKSERPIEEEATTGF
jgi:hypothetical protein